MKAIDNSNLRDYRGDQGTAGFKPDVWYNYDSVTKLIEFGDHSLFPPAITMKKVHVRACDQFGGEVRGVILPPGDSANENGEVTLNLAALNLSKPLSVTATVIGSDGLLIADGSAHGIGASGKLDSWDIQKNA